MPPGTKPPGVSVVVPTFNRSHTITPCLQSVQEQSYPHWEAIVVDDGSTDQTADLVAAMCREDPRIRLVQLDKNQGAQAARNLGIRAAESRWIAFLDSDDRYLPDSLDVRLTLARQEEVSVVYSGAMVARSDGRTESYRISGPSGWVYRDFLRAERPTFPSLLVRKDAMERIGYLDERIVAFQEWDTAIRLAKHYRFAFTPRPTFVWDRRHPDALSRNSLRGGKGYEQVVRKHFVAMLRHGGPRILAHHYRVAAQWYQKRGASGAARRCYVLAAMWAAVDPKTSLDRIRRVSRLGDESSR